MSETVTVAVGHDSEFDRPFAYGPVEPDECADTEHTFAVEVPVETWARLEAAWKEGDAAMDALLTAGGVIEEGSRLAAPCDDPKCAVYPGRTWWTINVERTDDPEGWPQIDVEAAHYQTREEAEAVLASLPETIWTMKNKLVSVPKSSLRIERHGYGESVRSCTRCGWERREHEGSA